jgi:hypothetical protein
MTTSPSKPVYHFGRLLQLAVVLGCATFLMRGAAVVWGHDAAAQSAAPDYHALLASVVHAAVILFTIGAPAVALAWFLRPGRR